MLYRRACFFFLLVFFHGFYFEIVWAGEWVCVRERTHAYVYKCKHCDLGGVDKAIPFAAKWNKLTLVIVIEWFNVFIFMCTSIGRHTLHTHETCVCIAFAYGNNEIHLLVRAGDFHCSFAFDFCRFIIWMELTNNNKINFKSEWRWVCSCEGNSKSEVERGTFRRHVLANARDWRLFVNCDFLGFFETFSFTKGSHWTIHWI